MNLFPPLQALQKIDSLSGGQKSRVAFAVLCGHSPNFLIMDEPTNHLDIQTIEALGNALCEYKVGTLGKTRLLYCTGSN